MGSINKQISRYDFTAVYTHPEAKVDIVLIHGLNGEPQRSWTAKNGVFWPADLLPASLKTAHANVLVYGYNADVYSSRNDRSASDNFIHHHAQTLVTSLTHYRKSEDSMHNPIIWVAHSLGGILTKSALLYSNDLRNDHHQDYRSIFVSTYAIVFLGTPHLGADVATWGSVLQSMSDAVIPKRFFESEPVLLRTLKRDSETLQNINNHFLDIYQRFMIHMAHENHKTDIKGTKIVVVDSGSASPQLPGVTYYGIEATHSGICKFESVNAPGYRIVATAIREWVIEAPPVIQVRWLVELEDREARARLEFSERRIRHLGTPTPAQSHALVQHNNETTLPPPELAELPGPDSAELPPQGPAELPTPEHIPPLSEASESEEFESNGKDEPLFIHPEPFRPNSFFAGREHELKHLHKMLMDRKRRSEGTSAVLIQCLPGGGKTHLARQYVFHYRHHYPGGIYWVRAKSQQEMEYWYWRIAKNEALKGLIAQEDVRELRNPKKIVAIVRKWLNSLDNWLLVLDGIHFDTPGIHEFIPDARDTSLIFTSTERSVTGDYQFDNPQVMELGLLSAQEAQELLLLEMDKRKPWTQDDRARALELVHLMGRLPLMIHVAAQQLKATREPLSKYLRSYKNRPKAGSLPAYKAVRDELQHRGATAALNLMSVLVFFDQHVPVEMLTLGLSALDNRTPVKTCDASHQKANLNNTLAVLITFALVERSESDDMSPNSSRSSRKSFDKNADYFDLLRIHSVVQAFFIDTLVEDKEIHFWLERAATVWCLSFDRADQRIKEDTKVGLPDDYRRYAIHGRRLVEHIDRFEKKSPEFLGHARDQIERRLRRTDKEIDQLSHTIQAHIIDGSGEVPPASVFERTSSSSETDSTTPPSHSSLEESIPILQDEQRVHSPMPYDIDYVHNPYHWHVPYPHRPTMPPTPEPDDDDDDALTVVGPASRNGGAATPTSGPSFGPPGLSAGLLLPPPPGAFTDWELAAAPHRAVRRVEDRRYHDRAGAWRDSTVSDPRVSISREIAKGSIPSIRDRSMSPSRSTVTAESEAELYLHKIRTAAPPSSQGGGYIEIAGSFGAGTRPRPLLILGTNAYADPSATKTPENECSLSPAEFSTSLARIASSPSSWTTATMKRLKENLKPSPDTSDEQKSALATTDISPEAADPGLGDRLHASPEPLFRGSRSSNSSPVNHSPPFPRPAPIEMSVTSSPQGYLPPTVRHWETHAYHPKLERLASSGLSYPRDPMSLSYPFPQLDPYSTIPTPPPWIHAPGGYTSQPMTRDASHQSVPSPNNFHPTSSPHHSQPAIPSSTPTRTQSPLVGSSPPPSRPSSSLGDRTSSRFFPFHRRRRRRPSLTETEPSPRLDAAFPDVRTSYQRWEGRQQHIPTTQPPSEERPASPPTWRLARAGRGRRRAAAAASLGRRAQSQSPTPMAMSTMRGSGTGPLGLFAPRRRGTSVTRGREEDVGGADARAPGSVVGAEMFARSEPGFGSGSGSGPGSGGFMLPDGTVVGFGEVGTPVGSRRGLSRPRATMGGWGSRREGAGAEERSEGLGLGIQ